MKSLFRYLLPVLVTGMLFTACKSQKKTVPSSRPTTAELPTKAPNTGAALPTKQLSRALVALQPLNYSMPEMPREFRGVWIATVANIDWPISPDDPYAKQKQDFVAILDYYKTLNFNAVIVQVRAAGDAFYPSNLAPWSEYLTGKQGQAPATSENPLTWMINEVHARGMEFHAWLNPYRATMDLTTADLSPDHDYNLHRNWMVKYGTRYYYNPGLPEVKSHLLAVIKEIVANYDIDAVHFDDYFYPYKIPGQDFPDLATYNQYKKAGQSHDDWRRENVNGLIFALNQTIKQSKPWVQFGISPFGVWRNQDKDPKGSPTQAGQTNYDDLYADVLKWMQNDWIDYLIPQLYWSMDHPLASHRKLNDWWARNHFNTNIYIGNGPYKIRDDADQAWKNPREINNQISYTRTLPTIQGNAFFSAKSMKTKNQDVAQLLKNELYNEPALPPSFRPKQSVIIDVPVVFEVETNSVSTKISMDKPLDPAIRYALIQGANELEALSTATIHPVWVGGTRSRTLEVPSLNTTYLAIRWIDHYGRIVQDQVYKIP